MVGGERYLVAFPKVCTLPSVVFCITCFLSVCLSLCAYLSVCFTSHTHVSMSFVSVATAGSEAEVEIN